MNVLFVGLGSIGNRHSKNLKEICRERNIPIHITALRSNLGSLKNCDFPQIDEMIYEPDGRKYDVVFITNPTTLHYDAYKKLAGYADYFFIEKPIFANTSVTLEEAGMSDSNIYVAAPMRFTSTYMKLKEILSKTHIFSSRIICSSYLPDWRPGQDYREVYSAKKELGGGVGIDLIHEIDYMVDLFGFPKRFCTMRGRYSNLEINSNDLCTLLAEYDTHIAEVHLDYFGRTYRRNCECFTENGSVIADFGLGTVTLPSGEVIDCKDTVNDRYVREMNAFLDFIEGKGKNLNPPSLAFEVLKISRGENK